MILLLSICCFSLGLEHSKFFIVSYFLDIIGAQFFFFFIMVPATPSQPTSIPSFFSNTPASTSAPAHAQTTKSL